VFRLETGDGVGNRLVRNQTAPQVGPDRCVPVPTPREQLGAVCREPLVVDHACASESCQRVVAGGGGVPGSRESLL